MAKRFTDTEKWEDPWFRNLLREYQMFWIYILDKCDNAGVWKVDFEMAEFCLKQRINEKEMYEVFKNRVVVFDDGERWFIPKFISFQYGQLDDACHPHKSILKLLKGHKIEGYLEGINTPNTRTRQDKNKIKKRQGYPTRTKVCYLDSCGKTVDEKEFMQHMATHVNEVEQNQVGVDRV